MSSYETITEVVNNPSYTEVAKQVSAAVQEPTNEPTLDRAALDRSRWSNFGGEYMRPPTRDLNFFQYHF